MPALCYKRHKEEFYDSNKKDWAKCHATVEEDLDAKDDEAICNALATSGTGTIFTLHTVYYIYKHFIVFVDTYTDGNYFEGDYFIEHDLNTTSCNESSGEEKGKEYWDVEIEDVLRDFDNDCDLKVKDVHRSHNNIVQLMLMFLLLWRSFYSIPAVII